MANEFTNLPGRCIEVVKIISIHVISTTFKSLNFAMAFKLLKRWNTKHNPFSFPKVFIFRYSPWMIMSKTMLAKNQQGPATVRIGQPASWPTNTHTHTHTHTHTTGTDGRTHTHMYTPHMHTLTQQGCNTMWHYKSLEMMRVKSTPVTKSCEILSPWNYKPAWVARFDILIPHRYLPN